MTEPRIARCGALVLLHHPDVPTEAQARAEVEAMQALATDDEIALLLLVDRVFPPPGAEVRAIYTRSVEGDQRIRAFAMLSEGVLALGLAMTMSIVMQVFGGARRVPYKVFSNRDATATWLTEQLDLKVTSEEVCAAIAELRAR